MLKLKAEERFACQVLTAGNIGSLITWKLDCHAIVQPLFPSQLWSPLDGHSGHHQSLLKVGLSALVKHLSVEGWLRGIPGFTILWKSSAPQLGPSLEADLPGYLGS